MPKLPRPEMPAMRTGYESPSEENQPPFFTQTTSASHLGLGEPAGNGSNTPISTTTVRPTLAARPAISAAALNDLIERKENSNRKVGLRDRIACHQWNCFTMNMATGGMANVFFSVPFKAHWITGIGLCFLFLNICLFTVNVALIVTRFSLRPGSFTKSFTDQTESLFIAAFVVSIAIILINSAEYGIPHAGVWLVKTIRVTYWFYVPLSVVSSAGMYLILWSTLIFPVHTMTPTWVFPAYPLLLTAPFAAQLIRAAESSGHGHWLDTPAVALCAITTQGTGCFIAILISSAFIYRLMTQKLPQDMQRPGIFISIGPYAFTAVGVVQLGQQADKIVTLDLFDASNVVSIMKVVSVLVGLWFWGFSLWFLLVSLGSLWKYTKKGHSLPFQMTWWSFVFPNTALIAATHEFGTVFNSTGIKIFGCVMTAILVIAWSAIFITMVYCIRAKRILYPKRI